MTFSGHTDIPDPVDAPAPPFIAAILRTQQRMLDAAKDGDQITFEGIAQEAWRSLTDQQRATAVDDALAMYAKQICWEHNHAAHTAQLDADAADDHKTYLDKFDTTSLWDSATSTPDQYGGVDADRAALLNVLCELELLQHRLAMLKPPATGPDPSPHP